jgi:hypothetical protein
MSSITNLDDMKEKVLHLWRYHQKTVLNFKYHPLNYYQHPYLRVNTSLLDMVIRSFKEDERI